MIGDNLKKLDGLSLDLGVVNEGPKEVKQDRLGLDFDGVKKIPDSDQNLYDGVDSDKIVLEQDDEIYDLLASHMNDSESTYIDQDEQFSSDLIQFMDETEAEHGLMPDDKEDSGLVFPCCFLDKVTPIELSFYVKEGVLLSEATEETLPFAIKLGDEFVQAGYIVPSLRTFRYMRRLCKERVIYIANDSKNWEPVTPDKLALFILEDSW